MTASKSVEAFFVQRLSSIGKKKHSARTRPGGPVVAVFQRGRGPCRVLVLTDHSKIWKICSYPRRGRGREARRTTGVEFGRPWASRIARGQPQRCQDRRTRLGMSWSVPARRRATTNGRARWGAAAHSGHPHECSSGRDTTYSRSTQATRE